MTIDWITVSAQIVNFLILVWLLQHFLYQPVVRAMDRREQRITERLDQARQREQAADQEAERYQREREELEERRDEIMAEVRREAEQQNEDLLEEGREKAAEARQAWQRQVEREKQEFLGNLRRRTSEAVQDLTRRVLDDLADTDLESRIIDNFIARLGSLDEETRRGLVDDADGTVSIASAFELDSATRGRLTRAVHEHLAEGLDVEYGRSDDLVCGIVLDHQGRRLSWNVADYLDELTERVASALSATQAGESGKAEDPESASADGPAEQEA